jgi:hypothetical protein
VARAARNPETDGGDRLRSPRMVRFVQHTLPWFLILRCPRVRRAMRIIPSSLRCILSMVCSSGESHNVSGLRAAPAAGIVRLLRSWATYYNFMVSSLISFFDGFPEI